MRRLLRGIDCVQRAVDSEHPAEFQVLWHSRCSTAGMCAKCVEELLVYQKALDASDDVSAILSRRALAKDARLRNQLAASSERVPSSISEGFAQSTDRHFASYLYRARGSSSETRTQLRVAWKRRYITESELKQFHQKYNEIERMLTGLIQHLLREDRQQRG